MHMVLFCKNFAWCRGAGLNCRRKDFQSFALPLSYLGVVGVDGLEPSTSALSELRSNHLSYTPSNVHTIARSIPKVNKKKERENAILCTSPPYTMKERSLLLLKINNVIFLLLIAWVVFDYATNGITYQLLHNNTSALGAQLQTEYFALVSLVFIFIVVIEVVIGIIPGPLLYPLGGILFHPLLGAAYILIGNALGSTIAYFEGMFLRKKVSRKKPSRFAEYLRHKGSWGVFLLRLNPLTSLDLLSYAAGALHLRFSFFLIATVAGITPTVIALTYFGEQAIAHFDQLTTILLATIVLYAIIMALHYYSTHTKHRFWKR